MTQAGDYAGDVSPQRCFEMVEEDGALVVDVRTRPEWAYVGMPVLPQGKGPLIPMEWQHYPDMSVDGDFARKLDEALRENGHSADTPICFLCRSGVRSLAAARAMAALGWQRAYNVEGGFEGNMDAEGHRGTTNGWKASGLPWRQS